MLTWITWKRSWRNRRVPGCLSSIHLFPNSVIQCTANFDELRGEKCR